jgi:hypothetical protein
MPRRITFFKTILPALAGCGLSFAAYAGPLNIVQNGGFEQTNMTLWCSAGTDCADQITTSNVSDWSTSGYNFIYTPQSTRTSGQYIGDPLAYQTGGGQVGLYNAAAPGSYTGGYNTIFNSPAGGNIVGADGAYSVGAITQSLTGLEKGGDYAITFWYAGAQQGHAIVRNTGAAECKPWFYRLVSADFCFRSDRQQRSFVLSCRWHAEWRAAVFAARWRDRL